VTTKKQFEKIIKKASKPLSKKLTKKQWEMIEKSAIQRIRPIAKGVWEHDESPMIKFLMGKRPKK
jgi:hypothetical protein